MEVLLDCIPCHIRQAINAAKTILKDKKVISKTIEKVLKKASCFDEFQTNFHLYLELNEIIKEVTGGKDPYEVHKKAANDICLSISKELKERISASSRPFETAVRIALAGNVIDVMQGLDHGLESVRESIRKSFEQEMDEDLFDQLKKALIAAQKVLYIGDNAGEIVFDKIFIEYLINEGIVKKEGMLFAVRGGPTVNDATIEDAVYVGLTDTLEVIDTGAEMPFAYLPFCSEGFNNAYDDADVVVAKGMGNFEGLMNEKGKDTFFLLKIKCEPIRKIIGDSNRLGDIVILRQS